MSEQSATPDDAPTSIENLFKDVGRLNYKNRLAGGLDDRSLRTWTSATSEVLNREPTGRALNDLTRSIKSYRLVSKWLFLLMITLVVVILALGIGLGIKDRDEGNESFILGYTLTGIFLLVYLLFVIYSFEKNNFIKRQILSSVKLSVPAMSKCLRQYEAFKPVP